MTLWPWWVCIVALMLGSARGSLAPLPDPLVFVKFYKVGGTTVADVLGRMADEDGLNICCGRGGCQMCYTHDTLHALRKRGLAAFPRGATLITLLRDPVERELSRYYYDRARGERRASSQRLEVWVQSVGNEYAQVLGQGSVEQATRVLDEHFALVGITERSHDFMTALGLRLGQEPQRMAYQSLKRVVGRPTQQDVSVDALETLRARLYKDIAIYRHAQRLFEEQWESTSTRVSREWYGGELHRLSPNVTCSFEEHRGAAKLHGKDCLRARP